MMDSSVKRVCPREGVVFRPTKSGGLLVDVETGGCFQLNPVAAEIWTMSTSGSTIARIVEVLSSKYGIAADVAEADVHALCEDIIRAGLANTAPRFEGSTDDPS
jgi:hypothetical protein